MRVGLSMLTLVPGVSGGSETYARGLAAALARRGELDVTAFVPTLAPDAGEGLPTEVVTEYAAGAGAARRTFALARARVLGGALRRRYAGLDVVHYPLTVRVPRLEAPAVLTLHDLQHLDLPQLFDRGTRAFRRRFYDDAAREAQAVVCPSAFVRDRALELLSLDPARVHAVHSGVDHERFRPGSAAREPFLLYPARPWPHKNHARLLEAYALLRAREPELRLVLTGAGTEALAGPPGVEARGAVGLDELVDLYRRAACLVFPSRYEGFGQPPLEAMACGTPVAAARAGSVPEVCGDAAVLFDPDDAEAIAAAVTEAHDRAPELSILGLRRAASFTWEAAAAAHEDVYLAAAA
jgi:glycosyltransferase involved in cell wall biosynthesis